jgi:hypothetical protein
LNDARTTERRPNGADLIADILPNWESCRCNSFDNIRPTTGNVQPDAFQACRSSCARFATSIETWSALRATTFRYRRVATRGGPPEILPRIQQFITGEIPGKQHVALKNNCGPDRLHTRCTVYSPPRSQSPLVLT